MLGRVEKLSADRLSAISPACRESVFFELDPKVASTLKTRSDRSFEKEAWLANGLLEKAVGGFNIFTDKSHAVATILYCDSALAPGCEQFPTAPASKNSPVITSLHIDAAISDIGLEALLLDAVLYELLSMDVKEVEAFGYYPAPEGPETVDDPQYRLIADNCSSNGLMCVETLLAAGFKVIRDHPVIPRLHLELPPPHELLSAKMADDILARAMA